MSIELFDPARALAAVGIFLAGVEASALYADGGCIDENPSPFAGTWAFTYTDKPGPHEGERLYAASGVLPAREFEQSVGNNLAEFAALLFALSAAPDGWHGQVYCDSHVTLGRFFSQYAERFSDKGRAFALKGIPERLASRLPGVLRRIDAAMCTPVLLSGHPTKAELLAGQSKEGRPVSIHNVWCDKAATKAGYAFREAPYFKAAA